MRSPAPQEQQSLEFYKIQVMQKDREIADFTAKVKKIQFKHSRELKQLKLSKERFEGLLKDQKNKSDKFSKLAHENKGQNQILELRLLELKREKERQISEIQSKYNILKEEVRSYERILPTFTFLSEIGQNISELPNYEDLYFDLKTKTQEHNDLESTFRQAQNKWQQVLKNIKANEQILKNKKNEAEKHLKEVLSKFQENQYLICDLRIQNQELLNKNTQLQQQLQFIQQRCQSLQNSLKEYEQKIEKLGQNFENDLILKEQQVFKAYQVEMIQLEEQLRNQQSLVERKENMFNQQIRLLEEEMAYLNNKYQAEIETFEEHYLSIKEETQRMKNQILHQRGRYDQLHQKFHDSEQNRIQINFINSQTQERNKALEQKISIYENQIARQSSKRQLNQTSSFKELQKDYEGLLQKMNIMSAQLGQLQEQRDHLQQQNFLLRQQIASKQLQHNNESKSFLFDFSKAVQNFEGKMMKKSSQVQNSLEKNQININNKGIVRDRRNSFYENNNLVQDFQKQQISLKEKLLESQKKLRQVQNENSSFKSEMQIERLQKQKIMKQNIMLKQKVVHLNKINNEHQKTVHGNSTKNNMQKTKIDSLQEELKLLNEENKREKEVAKKLKDQIKILKQASSVERQSLLKEAKDSLTQLQSIKIEKQKLKIELANKQRLLNHETALLKNSRQLQEKLKEKIQLLNTQKKQLDNLVEQFKTKQNNYLSQIHLLQKELHKLETALKLSIKENQRTNQSLQRQRKQRSLLTVPSLHAISEQNQDEAFNKLYATIPQKQGQINLLQRQIMDLKQQMETIRLTHSIKLEALQSENNEYVQTIIQMKMRCAQSEMRASQKEYLYMQLKKKLNPNPNPKDINNKFLKP